MRAEKELRSQYAFIFEAAVLRVRVMLRLSGSWRVPPLLSKPACAQLGVVVVIDAEHHPLRD